MPDALPPRRVGVWLIGARGSVATTAVAGVAAVRAGLRDSTGMVTEQLPVAAGVLPGLDELVFGGHDVSDTPLLKHAEELADDGVIPASVLRGIADDLDATDARIRVGFRPEDGEGPVAAIARLTRDIAEFAAAVDADRVVVVNVASTEAPVTDDPAHADLASLQAALAEGRDVLPPSSLYALAAFSGGCSFVDFTPSVGPRLPALDEAARRAAVPYAGSDGKTGETLVKAALAPMFATRALRVRSWAGTNLLGGGDGATLADPERVSSKLRSKVEGIERVLGGDVVQPLHIDYVPDMGGWKTAWDHIAFEGFLGVKMRMQFTWEGCDSALAAPLIVDLARLVAAAHRSGMSGALPELSYFFKAPLDDAPVDLGSQYQRLCDFAASLSDDT
jgi:myo-inositol-1-phosphate synthase